MSPICRAYHTQDEVIFEVETNDLLCYMKHSRHNVNQGMKIACIKSSSFNILR